MRGSFPMAPSIDITIILQHSLHRYQLQIYHLVEELLRESPRFVLERLSVLACHWIDWTRTRDEMGMWRWVDELTCGPYFVNNLNLGSLFQSYFYLEVVESVDGGGRWE